MALRFGSGPRGLLVVSQTVSFVALCIFGTPHTLNPGPIIVGLAPYPSGPNVHLGLVGKTGEQSIEGGLAASDKGKAWDPVISTELWARKHYFGFFPKCKKVRKCPNRLAKMSQTSPKGEVKRTPLLERSPKPPKEKKEEPVEAVSWAPQRPQRPLWREGPGLSEGVGFRV